MALSVPASGLLGTHVTWEDVQEALQESLKTTSTFGPNKTVKNIGEGNGFSSIIGLVEPDWLESNDQLPEKVVVKIISQLPMLPYCDDNSEMLLNEEGARKRHNFEVSMYELMEKYRTGDVPLVKILAVKKCSPTNTLKGLMITEYVQNLHPVYIVNKLELPLVKQILRSLASLHAIGLRLSPEEKKELEYDPFDDIFGKSEENVLNLISDLRKFGSVDMSSVIGRLEKEVTSFTDEKALTRLYKANELLGMSPILCHGDIWTANLLFSKKEDQLKLAAFIDFQTTHMGSPGCDLAVLISCLVTSSDRISHLEEMIDEYYGKLREEVQGEMPFTKEQLLSSYYLFFPMTVFNVVNNMADVYTRFEGKEEGRDMPERATVIAEATALLEDVISANQRNMAKYPL